MSKLTLSVDPLVVARAKRFAKRKGVSVSGMVEAYLSAVSIGADTKQDNPPILRSVRGTLRKADPEDHKRYLIRKYR